MLVYVEADAEKVNAKVCMSYHLIQEMHIYHEGHEYNEGWSILLFVVLMIEQTSSPSSSSW